MRASDSCGWFCGLSDRLKLETLLCAGLALCAPVAASAAETVLADPYYREAEFHRQQGQPLFALGGLLAARKDEKLTANPNEVELLLGKLYQDYGLYGQAADSFQRATGTGVGSLRGKAWWELARQRFDRGEFARAEAALNRSTGLLPYELEKQRPLLQAQILLAQNRNAEAAALLSAWQPIQQQGPYSRYNIGVALVRSGDLLQGSGMLDSVGTMQAPDAEMLALRDQANLAMGYGFLRADHGATARPLLKRVRLDGAYSNLALLGAGWAELAPDGKPQQNLYLSPVGCVEDPSRVLPESLLILRRPPRQACDRERTFKSRVFFEQAPGAGSEPERYRRAIVPWQTLTQRSPADPAVQEALLALPYAYSQLKGRDQAIEHYRTAIASYESERKALTRTTDTIRETAFVDSDQATGSTWKLPRREDALYLRNLSASGPYLASLRDLRALQTLSHQLGLLEQRLGSMESRLDGLSQPLAETSLQKSAAAGPAVTAETADAMADQRITYFGVFDFLPAVSPGVTTFPADGANENLPSSEPEQAPTAVSRPPISPKNPTSGLAPVEQQQRLRQQLETLRTQLASAQKTHETVLREMALAELASQQQRLDIYLAQARFSLARLLDPDVAQAEGF